MNSEIIVETLHQIQEDGSVLVGKIVYDEMGGSIDPPNEDWSGEDAWEWIDFRDGQERDDWRLENSVCSACGVDVAWDYETDAWFHNPSIYGEHEEPIKPALQPTDILIERYEHGLVRYAPIGESSQFDRQWDVAFGVAVIRFTKPDTIGPDDDPDKLLNFARGICDEYTKWCNGEVYGIVVESFPTIAHYETAQLEGDDGEDYESVWGFLGLDYALEELRSMIGMERQPA